MNLPWTEFWRQFDRAKEAEMRWPQLGLVEVTLGLFAYGDGGVSSVKDCSPINTPWLRLCEECRKILELNLPYPAFYDKTGRVICPACAKRCPRCSVGLKHHGPSNCTGTVGS